MTSVRLGLAAVAPDEASRTTGGALPPPNSHPAIGSAGGWRATGPAFGAGGRCATGARVQTEGRGFIFLFSLTAGRIASESVLDGQSVWTGGG
jgi:hypothetical protein